MQHFTAQGNKDREHCFFARKRMWSLSHYHLKYAEETCNILNKNVKRKKKKKQKKNKTKKTKKNNNNNKK